jgi:hypothetical protein
MVIFPRHDAEVGEYRRVRIARSNSATLFGELIDVNSRSQGTDAAASSRGQHREDVLYDLSPLVISTVEANQHSGVTQPAASNGLIELPIVA